MKWWTSEWDLAVYGKLTMVLISQICESGSVTVDQYILGEFHQKYWNMENWQKDNLCDLRERRIFTNKNKADGF